MRRVISRVIAAQGGALICGQRHAVYGAIGAR
jgi:hypothetical protein